MLLFVKKEDALLRDSETRNLAVALSALAGYVDAVGFLRVGGYFVSFMSGNSTRLAVDLAAGAPSAFIPAALTAAFMAGVVTGSLAGTAAAGRRRPLVLLLVAAILAIAAALATTGKTRWVVALMAAAMGAENAVFEHDGEVRIGLTYMTGTLVKCGQRLAAALLGGPRWDWTPYLLQWLGLLAGAIAGALAYATLGMAALWIAVAGILLAAAAAARMPPAP